MEGMHRHASMTFSAGAHAVSARADKASDRRPFAAFAARPGSPQVILELKSSRGVGGIGNSSGLLEVAQRTGGQRTRRRGPPEAQMVAQTIRVANKLCQYGLMCVGAVFQDGVAYGQAQAQAISCELQQDQFSDERAERA